MTTCAAWTQPHRRCQAHRRDELVSQIRDHLQEALRQAPAGDKAAVRNVLERLGPPEEIAAAATDSPPPPGQLAADFSQVNGLAIASVLLAVLWFAGLGAVLALVFGYRARREIENSAGSADGLGPGYRGHHPRLDRDHDLGGRSHPDFVPPP